MDDHMSGGGSDDEDLVWLLRTLDDSLDTVEQEYGSGDSSRAAHQRLEDYAERHGIDLTWPTCPHGQRIQDPILPTRDWSDGTRIFDCECCHRHFFTKRGYGGEPATRCRTCTGER